MFPAANPFQSQITRRGERCKNKHGEGGDKRKTKPHQSEVRNEDTVMSASASASAPPKGSVSDLTFKEFKPGTALSLYCFIYGVKKKKKEKKKTPNNSSGIFFLGADTIG